MKAMDGLVPFRSCLRPGARHEELQLCGPDKRQERLQWLGADYKVNLKELEALQLEA